MTDHQANLSHIPFEVKSQEEIQEYYIVAQNQIKQFQEEY